MIRCAVFVLVLPVMFESVLFASLNNRGWRAWPEIIMHGIAFLGCFWLLVHPHAVNTGHLILLLAMLGGFARTWIYRFGFDRRVRG